jgi:hypothetical protein
VSTASDRRRVATYVYKGPPDQALQGKPLVPGEEYELDDDAAVNPAWFEEKGGKRKKTAKKEAEPDESD